MKTGTHLNKLKEIVNEGSKIVYTEGGFRSKPLSTLLNQYYSNDYLTEEESKDYDDLFEIANAFPKTLNFSLKNDVYNLHSRRYIYSYCEGYKATVDLSRTVNSEEKDEYDVYLKITLSDNNSSKRIDKNKQMLVNLKMDYPEDEGSYKLEFESGLLLLNKRILVGELTIFKENPRLIGSILEIDIKASMNCNFYREYF